MENKLILDALDFSINDIEFEYSADQNTFKLSMKRPQSLEDINKIVNTITTVLDNLQRNCAAWDKETKEVCEHDWEEISGCTIVRCKKCNKTKNGAIAFKNLYPGKESHDGSILWREHE